MSLFKKIIFIIAAIFILILGTWFSIMWHRFIRTPMCSERKVQQVTTIKVPVGTGIHYLAYRLSERSLIKHPKIFILLARLTGGPALLKSGEYQVTRTMTPRELLNNIVVGKVKQWSVTFIEGWTFRQFKEGLKANSHIHHTVDKLSDQKIMEKLGDNRHPEGLFFPDTYFFTCGDTDFQILRQSYNQMKIILKKIWYIRSKNLPYKDPYQALIVASLIEKETALPKERPEIAGVILRRLKKRMPLQVDPTVLYGLGRPYDSPITKDDLVSHTPYNTYQNYGLPPTPIDMPSHESILAAVNPASKGALYYVARGDGSHVFSSTYQAHHEAVKKYQRNYEYEKVATISSWITPYLSMEEKYGK